MLTTEWRTFPAGRALDALVAERVMGFVWRRPPTREGSCKGLIPPDEFPAWEDLRGDERIAVDYARFVPHYSTDIAAAWQVVAVINPFTFRLTALNDGLLCDISHSNNNARDGRGYAYWREFRDRIGDAGMPALAICRAALAAVEGT